MHTPSQGQSTIRAEMDIGRRCIPQFAWPTVILGVALYAGFAAVVVLAIGKMIPLWLAIMLNSIFIYSFYTVVHEAVHGNISSRIKGRRWVDVVAGTACCAPLWLMFDHHKKSHMVHHSHTNEDDDPDIYARGSFLGWICYRLPISLLSYFNPFTLLAECRKFGCSKSETRRSAIAFTTYTALALIVIAGGYGYELLTLWLVPWWIGQTVMLTLFTWTPHHDHHETSRYRNTRVAIWPGAELLLLGQNMHLIHHMMPAIPFYRYRKTFDDLRPILEQHDVRIEGFWPKTPQRDLSNLEPVSRIPR